MLVGCSQLWGGSVSSMLVALSHFEQWINIRYFCKLRNSAMEMLVSLCEIYGVKLLKNPLCITEALYLKIGFIHYKMKCSWPALSMNDENVAKLLQL
jgi:hypothetical protein